MTQKDNTNDNCLFYLSGDAFAAVDNAWYDNENPDPTVEGQHATVLDDHCVSNNGQTSHKLQQNFSLLFHYHIYMSSITSKKS